jgi:hypothetical protein
MPLKTSSGRINSVLNWKFVEQITRLSARHAALQILAIARAIAAVCALPDTDLGRFVFQRTSNSGH